MLKLTREGRPFWMQNLPDMVSLIYYILSKSSYSDKYGYLGCLFGRLYFD